MLKVIAHKILPNYMRRGVWNIITWAGERRIDMRLTRLRRKAQRQKPGAVKRCESYTVRINDGLNFCP